MAEKIELSVTFNVNARTVYEAWLDSEEHAAFTGGDAFVVAGVGGEFNIWDGYITGRTLELEPNSRIVQAWRTTDFPEDAPDSKLEVRLEDIDGGSKLTLVHTDIPDGQGDDYKDGWKQYYFEPMEQYFLDE